jgi:hypothetical protein
MRWLAPILAGLLSLGDLLGAHASSVSHVLSIPDLARRADAIVLGDVRAVRSSWDRSHSAIYTEVEVAPGEVLKGASSDSVWFEHLGGRVGDVTSVVAGTPAFVPGEQVLVFLVRGPAGGLRLLNLFQGKFSLERDPRSGRPVATRRIPDSNEVVDQITLDHVRSQIRAAVER